jgi:hypothetical protein
MDALSAPVKADKQERDKSPTLDIRALAAANEEDND